jgi:hypothetical protein
MVVAFRKVTNDKSIIKRNYNMSSIVDELIRLDDSSVTSFLSCESNDSLIEYLPTKCSKSKTLLVEDIKQLVPSINVITILEAKRIHEDVTQHQEIVEDKRSLERSSTSPAPLEQDRAESLDFDDLHEISHEDFPEDMGDSDSENNSKALPQTTKADTVKGRKNVSFGLVRTHKICQGIDPPSNHALTESTDCDLTESELCSIEIYELNYRSPTKSSSRTRVRNRNDKVPLLQSLFEPDKLSETADTLESTGVPLEKQRSVIQSPSYHVIQAVDDGCPRHILLADNFDFPRLKRKTTRV